MKVINLQKNSYIKTTFGTVQSVERNDIEYEGENKSDLKNKFPGRSNSWILPYIFVPDTVVNRFFGGNFMTSNQFKVQELLRGLS